ncbi:DUF4129 domain-containing protein [Salibacterium salarium]|uniref:DUF4129 domain-containing protein n=1 Tax=Salibacterium salarium TaxID=284579 RepID=A0A3R9PG45_9BACI|nr:DUF4129 domain-containing protein [Salibacterium salarium]RSL29985.1 DUF4129 domain-containing protein [Salibacterium salarium]
MNHWRSLSQAGILMFCDAVWLYFILLLITSWLWTETLSSYPLAWIAAPLLGFAVSSSTRTLHKEGWVFFIHCLVLTMVLLPLWTLFYENIWPYSFLLSMALSYLYIRSSIHVFTKPTRLDMLLRFEGTVVFYLIITLLNQQEQLFSASFHVLFFFTLIMSLLGLMLTLYNGDDTSDSDDMETKTVGRSTPFPVIVGSLLGSVAIVSLLLLIPGVQPAFTAAVNGVKNGAIWVGTHLYTALVWFLNLFPGSNVDDPGLPPSPDPDIPEQAAPPAEGGGIPFSWIIVPLIILGVLAALWITSRLLQQRRQSAKGTIRKTKLKKAPFWKAIWNRLRALLRKWSQTWRKRSPQFYAYRIYWHFHKLTKWAKKQGITRKPEETPREFTKRITQKLPLEQEFEEKILELGTSYSATLYSEGAIVPEFDAERLTDFLKKNPNIQNQDEIRE